MLEEAAARDFEDVSTRYATTADAGSSAAATAAEESPAAAAAATMTSTTLTHLSLESFVDDVMGELGAARGAAGATVVAEAVNRMIAGDEIGDLGDLGDSEFTTMSEEEDVASARAGAGAGAGGELARGEEKSALKLLAFEMRRAVKTPAELRALLRAGFFRHFGSGLPTENFQELRDALAMMRGRRGSDGKQRQQQTSAAATAAAQGSYANDEDKNTRRSSEYEEKLEDIVEQLSDVEPRFDFEVSVVVRPIVQNLFAGWAGRTWDHAALRLAPQQVVPYAYSDPLSLGAVDLIPEVAAAYVKSLREMNLTRSEIAERVANAVNVRFVVTVIFVLRKQISVNGGDIVRNIFSLTL